MNDEGFLKGFVLLLLENFLFVFIYPFMSTVVNPDNVKVFTNPLTAHHQMRKFESEFNFKFIATSKQIKSNQ